MKIEETQKNNIQNLIYDEDRHEMSSFQIAITIFAFSSIVIAIFEIARYYILSKAENIPYKTISLLFVCGMLVVTTTIIYFMHKYFSSGRNALLQKQVNILHTILDNIPNPAFYNDAGGIFRGCNNAFEELIGLSRNEIIGKTIFDLTPLEEAEMHLYKDMELLNNSGLLTYEGPLSLKDGKKDTAIFSKSTFNDTNGKVKGLICVITDISQRIQMEQELRESEEKYKCIIELSSELIVIHDYEKIVFINEKGAKLIGANSADDIIGSKLERYIIFNDKKVQEEYFGCLKKGGKIAIPENKYIKQDGSEITLEVSAESFIYKGKKSVHVVARDISLRKKTEELSRKLNEAVELDMLRTEFFANISHELRTPLNVILSAVQMQGIVLKNIKADSKSISKMNRYINIITQNGSRLTRLINNLIDVTKIDSGYFQVNLKNLDFISLVENITLSVADYVQSMGIELIFDTNIEEKVIACDAEKIEKMMLNLLSNAVKFTEPGGKVYVTIEDREDTIVLYVKDTGIGIPEDKRDLVFERFIKVDRSLSRNCEGSGIGLSIVKSIVQMHNGKIAISSEYKQGAEFIIEMPVGTLYDGNNCETGTDLIKDRSIEKVKLEFSDIYK